MPLSQSFELLTEGGEVLTGVTRKSFMTLTPITTNTKNSLIMRTPPQFDSRRAEPPSRMRLKRPVPRSVKRLAHRTVRKRSSTRFRTA